MLIEDEELILEGLKNIIDWEASGMQVVHTAHNGEEAILLWEKEPVDIVVTDINMPVMNGLDFVKKLRERELRARCIILSGYDEFEYAREAIFLDVEDYILKPIDEEKLEDILKKADQKLREFDRRKAINIDDKAGWLQFLKGNLTKEETHTYEGLLPHITPNSVLYPALMKIDLESLKNARITDVLVELQKEESRLRPIYLSADSLLLLYFSEDRKFGQEAEKEALKSKNICSYFSGLQNIIESQYGILTFISIGPAFIEYERLPQCYRVALKLQKYQIIEGYGSSIDAFCIQNRQSEDISIDSALLRKLILKKDKDGAVSYIEDLFINNVKKEAAVDSFYQMSLKIAILLQDIKAEYKLQKRESLHDLTEIMERIYQAEDLFAMKTIFIGEIIEIIAYLNEADSQYTPVVKQIMSEVAKNYREDMNLKTLAYKYNMNASYLGQIFQKEVGATFAQYLSNTKNGIAKDLILNTNMRINDIAKEVGYPDTSYFYRKFKQCYGVSPASLREMKKY